MNYNKNIILFLLVFVYFDCSPRPFYHHPLSLISLLWKLLVNSWLYSERIKKKKQQIKFARVNARMFYNFINVINYEVENRRKTNHYLHMIIKIITNVIF